MTFFDERGGQISVAEWLKKYEQYYFLPGPTWRGVNRRNQSSRFVEDRVCCLLNQSALLSKDDLVLLMAWKMGLIDHGSSETHRKVIYTQSFDVNLISKGQYGARNFSKSIPYLAANMRQIVQSVAHRPQYLVDRVRAPHPELEGFGITYVLTVQFFVTHGRDPIYDKFAHLGAIAIHQGLKPGTPIKWAPVQDWSEYQGYVNLLKPISAACSQPGTSSSMTVPRPVDRSLWVYGHFFPEAKPMQNRRTFSTAPTVQHASISGSSNGTLIRCSIDSMSQLYANGRTRVVLAVRPECINDAPKLRLGDGRVPITLSTPVGDFEAGIRAWSNTSDRPYVCPDLRRTRTLEKTTLAIVLEDCRIPINAIVRVAVAGNTWKIFDAPATPSRGIDALGKRPSI
jgi:hypothetical protein